MTKELSATHITNTTPTGFSSPAQDYLKERISLDKEYIKHPLSTFFFEASGVSMINAPLIVLIAENNEENLRFTLTII